MNFLVEQAGEPVHKSLLRMVQHLRYIHRGFRPLGTVWGRNRNRGSDRRFLSCEPEGRFTGPGAGFAAVFPTGTIDQIST